MDLSFPLVTGMPVYPGDPEVLISSALTVAGEGANVLSLAIGSHSGTHVDAPRHVSDSWASLDELPLEVFSGTVEMVDVRGVKRGQPITAGHLAEIAPASAPGPGMPARLLLLRTGFAEAWGTGDYLQHPWLDAGAAQLIVDRGYRAVGLDALSVDPSPHPGSAASAAAHGFPAHDILAGNGCIIVENLAGLQQVQDALDSGSEVEIFLFPLSIPDADGAPIRAVARTVSAAQPKAAAAPGDVDLTLREVQDAAEALIAAFALCDTDSYFDAFSPDATFIFHPETESPASRSAYRGLWDGWLASGWKVLACSSQDQRIQLLGPAAVFSHRVVTTVQTDAAGGRHTSDERETIVFRRAADGSVRCVHEHLSLFPA
ncbi:cyclase family protein [Arthrobacter sp. EPSL27]|uniref:cyclase family protein n=1 Tax=Arthrobacter sp. EPSL27 TaxID=1745378 RepID=UPI000B339222|nr:cyclase family protein [Arthrobacter sp. EPSL27]